MLKNLLFSINISLPLFVLLGTGMFLRQKGVVTAEYVSRTTALVYHLMLPAKMFLDVASIQLKEAFDLRYMATAVGCMILQFLLAIGIGNVLTQDKRKQSAAAHACFRGNFMYLGLPLLQSIYGSEVVSSAALIVVLVIPLYNIQGVLLMELKEHGGELQPLQIVIRLLQNPIIVAILLALPFSLFQIRLPLVVTRSLGYFRTISTPLALLTVGACIDLHAVRAEWGFMLRISAVKLLLMPAMGVLLALMAGLTDEQLVTLTIACAMPSAINVYIVTEQMGGDGKTAGAAVVITNLLSVFTMTGIIFALRSVGFI